MVSIRDTCEDCLGETEAEGGGKSPTLEYQDMLAMARAEHKAAKSGAGGGGGRGCGCCGCRVYFLICDDLSVMRTS